MDRSDELKERPAEDARDTGEDIKRDGDVLGLVVRLYRSLPTIPPSNTTRHRSASATIARWAMTSSAGPPTINTAATGIDMGAGGHGTDVSQD